MTRALACTPKCSCRTWRIRRMVSLSVGIPSLHQLRWWIGCQVNTDLRDDLLPRMPPPGVAGIRLEWWPRSNRNGGRDQVGMVAAMKSEYLAALRWKSAIGDPTRLRSLRTPASAGQIRPAALAIGLFPDRRDDRCKRSGSRFVEIARMMTIDHGCATWPVGQAERRRVAAGPPRRGDRLSRSWLAAGSMFPVGLGTAELRVVALGSLPACSPGMTPAA